MHPNTSSISIRLRSVDFFRGLTMLLLIGEFSGIFESLTALTKNNTLLASWVLQLHHHPWEGLRFWDLIQPFFMVIVGISLALSVHNRKIKGISKTDLNRHVIQRSFTLLLLGWWLYCIADGAISWRFQNVLSQLAFTYPLSYLVIHKSFRFQGIYSLGFLILAEVLYRNFSMVGFDYPFSPGKNIGEWLELQLNGELPGGHWVSLNAISTTAHTVWGVMVGQLLLKKIDYMLKFKYLLLWALVLLLLGYGLSPVTPIIKRIATSSFVLVSGGFTLLAMALSYFAIDYKQKTKGILFFTVVGMNPLFIYLFAHVGGNSILEAVVHPLTYSILGAANQALAGVSTGLIVWGLLWWICWWLHTKRIYIRI